MFFLSAIAVVILLTFSSLVLETFYLAETAAWSEAVNRFPAWATTVGDERLSIKNCFRPPHNAFGW